MASLVNFGRFRRGLLPLILLGVIAGCSSGEETPGLSHSSTLSNVPTESTETVGLDPDEFGTVDVSAITAGFLPEISEDDLVVTETDAGTSYSYTFPTRDLADGVTVALAARWDPIDEGLRPSLEWRLGGDETSSTEFGFVVSIPKTFGESPAEMTFDPQPTEIIDADVVAKWTVDPIENPIITALSNQIVRQDDPAAVIMTILDHLNTQRIHAEMTACHSPFRDPETVPQCYLAVVAQNAHHFGTQSCGVLERMIVAANANDLSARYPYPGFAAACETVAELASSGASVGCDQFADNSEDSEEYVGCLYQVGTLMLGECPVGDVLEHQICTYDVAVALKVPTLCNLIRSSGNPEMADDCFATTTNDPKYCSRTKDAKLRASCCEVFRGTGSYDTCLGTPDATTTTVTEDTTTTVDENTTTTAASEETTTTEPGDENLPPAIPAGVYTGSFDARIMADVIAQDFGTPQINTMTIGIDAEGRVSGDLHIHQEGQFMGCPGAMSDWAGIVDSGQIIGPHLPLTVVATTKTMETVPFDATWADAQCLPSPEIEYNQGPLSLVFDTINGGRLSGVAEDYVPFELQLVP
jgi:hypothetical protein